MSGTPKTFKQADLERAIRAARACDLPVLRSEVTKDGRIILVHFDTIEETRLRTTIWKPNEWDTYFNEDGKE